MRVSDRATARNYLKYVNQAKTNFAKTNLQVASGNRFTKLSDDVSAGTRVMNSRMDMYKAQKHLDNVKAVSDKMNVAESSMSSISEMLSRAHQTLTAALSEEKGETGRKAIADELKTMKQELLQLVNTKYGNNYSFGGSNSSMAAPFTVGDDGYLKYNGIPINDIMKDTDGYYYDDGGVRKSVPMDEDVYMDIGLGITMSKDQLDDSSGILVSTSGLDVVGFGKNEQGQPRNIFNLLTDIEKNLRTYDRESVVELKSELDIQRDGFVSNLTNIGAKTKLLENMEGRLDDRITSFTKRISELMGTNYEEASMTQALEDAALKGILQMGSMVLPMSLMDFLR